MCCDLQVDVNGENIFLVDKSKVVSFSTRLSKMFGKLTSTRKNLKVIFPNFPGGAESFELILRFSYNNGRIDITPTNVFLLYCGADFMEMNRNKAGVLNLVKQTELYLEGIDYWTWSEFVFGLKQCQDLSQVMNSSGIFKKFLNCLVRNLPLPFVASPYTSSSDSSGIQFSGDVSTKSTKNCNYQPIGWFKDLLFLNIEYFEKLVKTMLLQNIDHSTICLFVFHYQKSRFFLSASPAEKCKTTETVINLLCLLEGNSITSRGILDALGMTLSLKMRRSKRVELEKLIGSRLDEATIDDLLVPSPCEKRYSYDVDLIIRLLKSFLLQSSNGFFHYRLKKVAGLIDLFMAEVAPDPWLKPSKFVALAIALPEFARESHDRLYQAIHMYIEVHCGLDEEQKIRVCSVLNLNKLSVVKMKHLAQNTTMFPPGLVGRALFLQQPHSNYFRQKKDMKICNIRLSEEAENIFRYAENIDFPTAYEKVNTDLPALRCRPRLSNAKTIPGLCHG